MYPFAVVFLYSLGKYIVVQLLGHRVVLFVTYEETSILFSRATVPVSISTNRARGCPFSISSSTPCVSCVVDFSHPDRYEVIFHYDFDLYFPGNQ